MTDYTVDSLLKALYDGESDLRVTEIIKKYSGFEVTTDLVGRIIPQIKWKYGTGVPCKVTFTYVDEAPYVTFRQDNITSNFTIQVTFEVKGEKALVAKFNRVYVTADVWVQDQKVHGKITNPVAQTVEIVKTTLEDVTEEVLRTEVKNFMDKVIGVVNLIGEAGYTIPVIHGLDLRDLEIDIHEGYAQVELNVNKQMNIVHRIDEPVLIE